MKNISEHGLYQCRNFYFFKMIDLKTDVPRKSHCLNYSHNPLTAVISLRKWSNLKSSAFSLSEHCEI